MKTTLTTLSFLALTPLAHAHHDAALAVSPAQAIGLVVGLGVAALGLIALGRWSRS